MPKRNSNVPSNYLITGEGYIIGLLVIYHMGKLNSHIRRSDAIPTLCGGPKTLGPSQRP